MFAACFPIGIEMARRTEGLDRAPADSRETDTRSRLDSGTKKHIPRCRKTVQKYERCCMCRHDMCTLQMSLRMFVIAISPEEPLQPKPLPTTTHLLRALQPHLRLHYPTLGYGLSRCVSRAKSRNICYTAQDRRLPQGAALL